MDAFQDDSFLSWVDQGNGDSQNNKFSHVPLELSLKSYDVSIRHDCINNHKAPIHVVDEVEMDIDYLDYTATSCSDDDNLCVAIGVSLNPYCKFHVVLVASEHSDCPLVFVPTFGGSIVDINKFLLLGSFHLELQTIVVCLNAVGPIIRAYGLMFVPSSHAKGHGHSFDQNSPLFHLVFGVPSLPLNSICPLCHC